MSVTANDLVSTFTNDATHAEAGIDRMSERLRGLGDMMQTALGTAGGFLLSELVKTCSKCGDTKPISDFYRQQGGKHGVRGRCKACALVDMRPGRARWMREHPEYRAANNRATFQRIKSDPERYAAYLEKGRERMRLRRAKQREQVPE